MMTEYSGALFNEADADEQYPWSIYIQTRYDKDETDDAIVSLGKGAIRDAAICVNFSIENTRVTNMIDKDSALECVLVGSANHGSIDEIVESVQETLDTKLAETPFRVAHVLLHECSNVPVFQGSGQLDRCWEATMNGLSGEDVNSLFSTHGYGVLKNCISDDKLMAEAIKDVRTHIASVLETVEAVKEANPKDRVKYREVMQRDEGRFDIALDDPALSTAALNAFVKYATPGEAHSPGGCGRAPWLNAVDSCLGEGCYEFNRSGVVLSTGGSNTGKQYWHADGQEHLAPCQALCLFIPLCDLTDTTGYTSFWPGSQHHKQSALLACDLPAKMPEGGMVQGKVGFGDCLMYDYKLIHRGEANHMAAGEIRPIMYIIYAVHGYSEPNFNATPIREALAKYRSGEQLGEQKIVISAPC